MIGGSFCIKKLSQFGISYYDDESGLIFDRPSGTVQKLNCDGSISAVYDFKDFKADLDVFINTAGQKERTAYACHKKEAVAIMIGQGLGAVYISHR